MNAKQARYQTDKAIDDCDIEAIIVIINNSIKERSSKGLGNCYVWFSNLKIDDCHIGRFSVYTNAIIKHYESNGFSVDIEPSANDYRFNIEWIAYS